MMGVILLPNFGLERRLLPSAKPTDEKVSNLKIKHRRALIQDQNWSHFLTHTADHARSGPLQNWVDNRRRMENPMTRSPRRHLNHFLTCHRPSTTKPSPNLMTSSRLLGYSLPNGVKKLHRSVRRRKPSLERETVPI
jgi:hypothetical protein